MNVKPNSNRELLVEVCRETRSIIANTCFPYPSEFLVTYYGPAPGVGPLSDVTNPAFAQLDYCLVDFDALSMISDIWTDRRAALPTATAATARGASLPTASPSNATRPPNVVRGVRETCIKADLRRCGERVLGLDGRYAEIVVKKPLIG